MPRIGQENTAVVTGCSSGLGLEFTRLLLKHGLKVWGLSRSRPPLDESERFRWRACDLSDSTDLEPTLDAIIAESGGVDLVVNNAGYGEVGVLTERSPEEVETAMRVVLLAPILTTRFFLRQDSPPAAVVNTSSLASEMPIPLMSVYNSGKAALSAFTLSMTLDGGAYPKTRFIDFRPGDYRTPFADAFRPAENDSPERTSYLERLKHHHACAPGPERAATDLWRAIQRGKKGTVRSGTIFQARLAPLGVRLLPAAFLRQAIRRYYGLARPSL